MRDNPTFFGTVITRPLFRRTCVAGGAKEYVCRYLLSLYCVSDPRDARSVVVDLDLALGEHPSTSGEKVMKTVYGCKPPL